MAAYQVSCKGSRGSVSRFGGEVGGVQATLSSWKNQVFVWMHKDEDDKDTIRIEISDVKTGETFERFDFTL